MPKLRKMLGDVNAPYCTDMMRLIETRSQHDLAAWSAAFVRERILPILTSHVEDAAVWLAALEGVDRHLAGDMPVKTLRPLLNAARTAAAALNDQPAQAAARAIATACAVCATPTGALGFLFYACAASAYQQLGLSASAEAYEQHAAAVFTDAYASLAAWPNDGGAPARIDWGC